MVTPFLIIRWLIPTLVLTLSHDGWFALAESKESSKAFNTSKTAG